MASASSRGVNASALVSHQQQVQRTTITNGRNEEEKKKGESITMRKAITQYIEDARLHAVFEQSDDSFDYTTQSVRVTAESVPEQQITAYLAKIQRDGFIQPSGSMIAVDEPKGAI